MPGVMRGVTSSHIARAGHNAETQELTIHWADGKVSIYSGVPASVADSVTNAWSVGKALHAEVKGKYAHRYEK